MPPRRGLLPVPPGATRALRIYALDPLDGGPRAEGITVAVPYEPLAPGPVGARVEVIDYDPAAGRYYAPVDLDDPHVLAQDGLAPSESDPRFHQQMTYAVVMTTLQRFEHALGRALEWGAGGRRLRVYPHGAAEANAYFSPELGALVFGYFRARRERIGRTLPGGHVFTCLSHDVVAHETAHALVHALRARFMEPTSPDTLAFHEAFADLVALLQHLSLPGVVEAAVQATRASLDDVAPLVSVGRQFRDALGVRGALRAALGERPDPAALARATEPHERGAILVAAVFAAMIAVYRRRSEDLLRIATGGSGLLPPGHIAPDLVRRLAAEARRAAGHFLNICVRALDYCPPVDVEFGEFLRAMVTADRELEPEDPWRYRGALVDAFRERGILPPGVFSLAESSVVWQPFDGRLDAHGIDFAPLARGPAAQERARARERRRLFEELVARPRNRRLFHLDPSLPVEVRPVQPLRRIGPDRRIHDEVVVELLQAGPRLVPHEGAPRLRGGTTLVVGEGGRVRYAVWKPLADRRRRERQRAWLNDLAALSGASAYARPRTAASLALVHRGMRA